MNRTFRLAALNKPKPQAFRPGMETDLEKAPAGSRVVVLGFNHLPVDQQTYLQAYGILPGREVSVLQHAPETVVQIEHTELAFENQIARQVLVRLR